MDFSSQGSSSAHLRVTANIPGTAVQNKLRAILGNPEVMTIAHRLLGEFCTPYVPMWSGQLRLSMKYDNESVRWETPYAQYQYEGIVYAPNNPIIVNGNIVGWYSRKGVSKYPTTRVLGTPGVWKGWRFGYSTENTSHHWLDKAMEGGGKRRYSLRLTQALKREVKRLN